MTILALVAMLLSFGCGASVSPRPMLIESSWQAEPTAFPANTFVTSVLPGTDAGTDPWVAVGWSAGEHGQPATACFTSTDARRWVACPLVTTDLDGAHTRLLGVGRVGSTVVAAGVAASALHGNPRPTLWQGDANGPLREVDLPRELFGGPRLIGFGGLATGPLGGFAAGTWDGATNQEVAQVWRTSDGVDWRRIDGVPTLTSTPDELLRGSAVAVGTNRVVLVGGAFRVHPLGDGDDGAVWWSGDGTRWTRSDLAGTGLTGRGDQELQVVAAGDRGFDVGGSDGSSAAVWSSPDGVTWTSATRLPGGRNRGSGATVTAFASAGGRRWAGGVVDGAPRLWSSGDGRRWAQEPLPPVEPGANVDAVNLAATGNLLMLVVRSGSGTTGSVVPLGR